MSILMDRNQIIEKYDQLVSKCSRFERKGKTMPYTSANGHMFSQINKEGQLGIRFGKEKQERYMKEWGSDHFMSYGAKMKGYVLVPDAMWNDLDTLAQYLNEGYDYVMSLEPK